MVRGVPGGPTLYTAGEIVWRSDDLGATWRALFSDPSQMSLEIAPTDRSTLWIGGEWAYSYEQGGFLVETRDGGADWTYLINETGFSAPVLAAHPGVDGLLLAGEGPLVLRTDDHGATITKALQAPPGVNTRVAWSPAGRAARPDVPTLGLAVLWDYPGLPDIPLTYISRDLGMTWMPRPGDALRPLRIYGVETDERWQGLAYAATGDGVYVLFGAGLPLCHDARAGTDGTLLWPGNCPPILSPGPVRLGDIIAVPREMVRLLPDRVELGEVHCLSEDADIAFATIDPPDPPAGEALLILSREEDGELAYGASSDGLPRLATSGDCK